jgi:starch-binding outer membrane protein, SusD/RagB family
MTRITHRGLYAACLTALLLGPSACKDQLDVGNPNQPTLEANVTTEAGLASLAQGGVYINGFLNGNNWLGNSYFSLPWGYIDLMGDMVGADASNNQVSVIGVPDYMILDNGARLTNPAPQVSIIRAFNNRSASANSNNPLIYQWQSMYALNNAANLVLSVVDGIPFTGDKATKVETVKAWCYWWKGYAYAQIGTLYYAGLVINTYGQTNGNYILSSAIIEESNKYYRLAETSLNTIRNGSDYTDILAKLIPEETQVGLGIVPTVDMWKRNINTMLARNILLNRLAPFVRNNPSAAILRASMPLMTAADWNTVLTLSNNGIRRTDRVFTGRATATNSFFSALNGTVSALAAGLNSGTTFKISERFVQNFNPGDQRLANNISTGTRYNNNFSFTTRHSLIDGGQGRAGVYVFGNRTVGRYELYIAGTYEENELMRAEANIRLGNIEAGLGQIDAVRAAQGAGLAATAGTQLTAVQALRELVRERRVALFSRGISFYDIRRWGWTYDIANGGGSYGNTVVTSAGVVNRNVTINYNFMDYWDVPADEVVLNPNTGGTSVRNPNY